MTLTYPRVEGDPESARVDVEAVGLVCAGQDGTRAAAAPVTEVTDLPTGGEIRHSEWHDREQVSKTHDDGELVSRSSADKCCSKKSH